MSAMQKYAWFNLAVIGLTVVTVLTLFPVMGKGALGGLGWLGLTGFGPFFLRGRPGQVVTDERDHLIQRRSWIVAYASFWVIFVLAAALLAPVVYGHEGAVPVWIIQIGVFVAYMLVCALASVAILVQYAGGARDGQ
jgi:hypothetical protein